MMIPGVYYPMAPMTTVASEPTTVVLILGQTVHSSSVFLPGTARPIINAFARSLVRHQRVVSFGIYVQRET